MRLVEFRVTKLASNLNRMIEWTALVRASNLEDLSCDFCGHSGHLLFVLSEELHQVFVHVLCVLRLSFTLDPVRDAPDTIIHFLIVNAFLILNHLIKPVEEVRSAHVSVDVGASWDLMAWIMAIECK